MSGKTAACDAWLHISLVIMFGMWFSYLAWLFPDTVRDYYYLHRDTLVISLELVVMISGLYLLFVLLLRNWSLRHREGYRKQLRLVRQVLWRSRYFLAKRKLQLEEGQGQDVNNLWQVEKQRYIREQLLPQLHSPLPEDRVLEVMVDEMIGSMVTAMDKVPTYQVDTLD